MTPQEALLSQIRKSRSVSDEYVFDGSNHEKIPQSGDTIVFTQKNPNLSHMSSSGENVHEDQNLLSQIRGGFKLKPVPNWTYFNKYVYICNNSVWWNLQSNKT